MPCSDCIGSSKNIVLHEVNISKIQKNIVCLSAQDVIDYMKNTSYESSLAFLKS